MMYFGVFIMKLYRHQEEDINRFKDIAVIPLFNEMGTGKSITAMTIALYKFNKGDINAVLVIAPNGVHMQWATEEVPKALDGKCEYTCYCVYGKRGLKKFPTFTSTGLHIICTNIDTFSTSNKWMNITEWANANKTFIILDEATSIKSPKAKRTQRILYAFNDTEYYKRRIVSSKPKSVARAILTGTPSTNGPMDLWAMMEFLQPNFFGMNWYAFQNKYAMHTVFTVSDKDNRSRKIPILLNAEAWEDIKKMNTYFEANMVFGISEDTYRTIQSQDKYSGPYKHAEVLRAKLNEVASFRLLKDCTDMPKQNYITRKCEMDDIISDAYDSMVKEFIAEYEGKVSTAKNKIGVMIRLQQISSGFISSLPITDDDTVMTADGDELVDDPKENEITWLGKSNGKLRQLYADVAELDKPIIIITHFSAEASRIYDDLSTQYRCCLMTGWRKIGSIDGFKEGEYDICIANIRVISRGFNMQRSHTVLFYSNTFSLEDRLQTEGRIWRIGQTEPCQYIDYVYENTIDEKIVSVLQQKQSFLEYIRNENLI